MTAAAPGASHLWRRRWIPLAATAILGGCEMPVEVRLHNASDTDFEEVTVRGRDFGTVVVGDTTAYRVVPTRLRYADLALTAGGRRITGQTLNFGSRRFTYRIAIADLKAGQLRLEVIGR